MPKKKKNEPARTRSWATVVYPESAPENWLDLLREVRVDCFVSPLHDLDHDPDGCVKKAHYHVLFSFPSVKSIDQVLELVHVFGGVGAEYVYSFRAYARYLCHLDNPKKAKYDVDKVLSFGVLDYRDQIACSSERYDTIKQIIAWIRENQCTQYNELLDFAMEYNEDWFRFLADSGTVVISTYLRSLEYKLKLLNGGK